MASIDRDLDEVEIGKTESNVDVWYSPTALNLKADLKSPIKSLFITKA
jgi:hypothetical protein